MDIKAALRYLKADKLNVTLETLGAYCADNNIDTSNISDSDLSKMVAHFNGGLARSGRNSSPAKVTFKVESKANPNAVDVSLANHKGHLRDGIEKYIDVNASESAREIKAMLDTFPLRVLNEVTQIIEEDGNDPDKFRVQNQSLLESFGFGTTAT